MLLLAAAVVASARYCDSESAQRQAARSELEAAMGARGYTAEHGTYACTVGTGGGGNPESVNCVFAGFGKLPAFQLGPKDVLVYYGCAPASPGPLYWGFSPYLLAFDAKNLLTGRPGAQLTDSLNHLLLNSTATAGSPDGRPWGGSFALVATADAISQRDATAALVGAGVTPGAVNTVVFPSEYLSLGTGLRNSFLELGGRAGPFRSADDQKRYTAAVNGDPVLLFRAHSRSEPAKMLPTPLRKQRGGTAVTELGLEPKLAKTVAGVTAWARARGWTLESSKRFTQQLRDGVYSNGTECATNRHTTGCALDTDDAAYFDSPLVSALTANQTMDVVVGVNSASTGKAEYSSLAVYTGGSGGQAAVLGGAAMSNLKYAGSALRFNPDAPELFALTVKASGGCGDERWCLETADAKGKKAGLVYVTRAYADPITRTGPSPDELLPAVLLRLRRD